MVIVYADKGTAAAAAAGNATAEQTTSGLQVLQVGGCQTTT